MAPTPRPPARPSPSPLRTQAEVLREPRTQPHSPRPVERSSGDTFTLTASTVATAASPAGAPTRSVPSPQAPISPTLQRRLRQRHLDRRQGHSSPSHPFNQSIFFGISRYPFSPPRSQALVNGDSASVVTGLPALSTTANSSSPAGSYPIVASFGTLSAANYAFTLGRGTLTILPASNPGVGFTGRAMAGTQPDRRRYRSWFTPQARSGIRLCGNRRF